MSYLVDMDDIKAGDELLGPAATERELKEAHEALIEMAAEEGVAEADIKATTTVKRYIRYYTYMITAVKKAFSLPGAAFKDGSKADSYSSKISFYQKEIEKLEGKLTKYTLTGEGDAQYMKTIPVFRG